MYMYMQDIYVTIFPLQQKMTEIEDYVIQRVKTMRIEHGWSQQELADNMNLSKSFVTDCESPKRRAKYNLNHLNELVKIWNCAFSDFFPDKAL